MLTTAIVTDLQAATTFGEEWDRLAVELGRPYAAPAWMLSWWRHAAPPGSGLRVVVVREGASLIGVAPFYVADVHARQAAYRTLGVGSFREPLAVKGAERDVAGAIAAALAASEPRPRSVSLEAAGGASWIDDLGENWPSPRCPSVFFERVETAPELELRGSFDEWFAASSGHFRKRMRAYRRQLDTLGAELRQAGPGELDRALDAFVRLHHARWRHRGGSSALKPPVERMIYDVGRLLPPDRFRLWLIEVRGEILCTEILVAAGGVVSSWLGGFDERIAAQRPSLVTILAAIEQCYARGDRCLDLGPGDQEWKRRFSGGEKQLAWVSLVPPGRGSFLVRSQIAGTRIQRNIIGRLPERHRGRLRTLKREVRRLR